MCAFTQAQRPRERTPPLTIIIGCLFVEYFSLRPPFARFPSMLPHAPFLLSAQQPHSFPRTGNGTWQPQVRAVDTYLPKQARALSRLRAGPAPHPGPPKSKSISPGRAAWLLHFSIPTGAMTPCERGALAVPAALSFAPALERAARAGGHLSRRAGVACERPAEARRLRQCLWMAAAASAGLAVLGSGASFSQYQD